MIHWITASFYLFIYLHLPHKKKITERKWKICREYYTVARRYEFYVRVVAIENTSWKVLAYGIYALVVFVSEILLVRCAPSFDFWYVNNSCVNTVRQHFPWSILYVRHISSSTPWANSTISCAKIYPLDSTNLWSKHSPSELMAIWLTIL